LALTAQPVSSSSTDPDPVTFVIEEEEEDDLKADETDPKKQKLMSTVQLLCC
jgi:hypothetical protein